MKKIIVAAIAGTAIVAACKPKTVAVSETSNIGTERLVQGKTIFENSCAKCHKLPDPTKHTAQQWVGIMNVMAPKAKLTDEQHKLVFNYIISVE